MSLQADKRDLNLRLTRYMTLLSNLSNPPAQYINDLDYLRGLVQIADQREYQGLTQTWETIRPKDGRSMRYIETGVLNDGRAVEIKSLLDLTGDILALRGGPTSGNWSHAGRKGKRGGSGGGGGFGRIGVKDGKKTGRKGIKRASRQTRGKRERGRGAGVPKRSGEIPVAVLGRAKATVASAKKTRDKDLGTARKSIARLARLEAKVDRIQTNVAKLDAAESKARDKFFTARDRRVAIDAELSKIFLATDDFSDPKVKKKLTKLGSQLETARKRESAARSSFEKAKDKAISAALGTGDDLTALVEARRANKPLSEVMKSFEKETEAASRIMFQNNLNEAKGVRRDIKNMSQSKEIKELEKQRDKQKTVSGIALASIKGVADKEGFATADRESNKLFEMDNKLIELRENIPQKAKSLLKVDNPTVIRQAPGSQKDQVNSPRLKDRRKNGQAGFQELVSDDVVPKGSLVKYQNTDTGRAFQRSGPISEVHMDVFSGPDTVVHELGHTAENYNSRTLKRSLEFRDRRTAGEEYQPLADLTGNQGYRKEEKAKPDKFMSAYMGKDYGKGASEIFSMGIEEMFRDPVGFAEKDPEMFDFIYAQARTP